MSNSLIKPFMQYFSSFVDYPKNLVFDPLSHNTFNSFVSEAYLNGFINHVEIIKAVIINRMFN